MASKSIVARHTKEVLKCGADPIYFFNQYCKIQHPTRGSIPFKTYPFQDESVEQFLEHKFNIVLKARQLGLSTVTAAYAVWMILFCPNSNILVIATNLRTAKNFIKKCKFIIKNLPDWLVLCDISSETVQSIETSSRSGDSTLKAVPTSPDAGRSEALSLLIVDEAAFVKDFDELWKGLYPTLSTGGRAILLSTPNGTGNKFHDLYTKARLNDNEFNDIVLPWHVHPEHDQEWFEEQTRQLSRKEIAQEHECDFIASGDTYIDVDVLEKIRAIVTPPIRRLGMDRNLWIWKEPEPEKKYILSADTARGDGKDYSAFIIIDSETGDQVAEYKGKMPPDRFAEMINEVALRYNTAIVCPENNSVGYATIQKLCDLKYPRIYNNKQKTLDLWGGSKSDDVNKPSGDLGIFTSGQKRNVMLTKMEELLRNVSIKIYSERTYAELRTFVWLSSNKVAAQKGNNDDLVLTLAIGSWLLDTVETSAFSEEDGKSLLDAITQDSVRLDEIITPTKQEDYSVFMPVAGAGSSTFGAKKKQPAQVLSKKWNWLIS
jgi:hypothetical protein